MSKQEDQIKLRDLIFLFPDDIPSAEKSQKFLEIDRATKTIHIILNDTGSIIKIGGVIKDESGKEHVAGITYSFDYKSKKGWVATDFDLSTNDIPNSENVLADIKDKTGPIPTNFEHPFGAAILTSAMLDKIGRPKNGDLALKFHEATPPNFDAPGILSLWAQMGSGDDPFSVKKVGGKFFVKVNEFLGSILLIQKLSSNSQFKNLVSFPSRIPSKK